MENFMKIGNVVFYGLFYFMISETNDPEFSGYRLYDDKVEEGMNHITLWDNATETLICFWYKPGKPETGMICEMAKFSPVDGKAPECVEDMKEFDPGIRPCAWCRFFTDYETNCEKGINCDSYDAGNCASYVTDEDHSSYIHPSMGI